MIIVFTHPAKIPINFGVGKVQILNFLFDDKRLYRLNWLEPTISIALIQSFLGKKKSPI